MEGGEGDDGKQKEVADGPGARESASAQPWANVCPVGPWRHPANHGGRGDPDRLAGRGNVPRGEPTQDGVNAHREGGGDDEK